MSKGDDMQGWFGRNRTSIGCIATVVWFAVIGFWAFERHGTAVLFALDPNMLGDFLAGFAAPVAFLWLILGYFQQVDQLAMQRQELELQRRELELQRKETARLADESRRQADTIGLTEAHARLDSFIRLHEFIASELHEITLVLLDRLVAAESLRDVRTRYSQGQRDAYARMLLSTIVHGNHEAFLQTMNRHMDRLAPLIHYRNLFDTLLDRAKELNEQQDIAQVLRQSSYGQLNAMFVILCELDRGVLLDEIQHRGNDAAEPA